MATNNPDNWQENKRDDDAISVKRRKTRSY